MTNQTKEDVSQLSKELGVSETDVVSFATSMVNSLKADGLGDYFLEEPKAAVLEKYMRRASDKMTQFINTYSSNPEAREAFQKEVLGLLLKDKKPKPKQYQPRWVAYCRVMGISPDTKLGVMYPFMNWISARVAEWEKITKQDRRSTDSQEAITLWLLNYPIETKESIDAEKGI